MLLDASAPSLPALLARYEAAAGLVANWRILGSSESGWDAGRALPAAHWLGGGRILWSGA